MSDQGILAVTPVNQGAGAPPPAPVESSDVGSPRASEDALLAEAMATLEGGEGGGEQPLEQQQKPAPAKPETEEQKTQARLSKGFAKLADLEERFERRTAKQTQEFQAERAAFEAERAELAPLKEAKARAASSPLEALSMLGWDYKSLVDYVMADGKIPPEKFAERLTNEHKTQYEKLQAQIEEMRQNGEREREAYEAQQETLRHEHAVRALFKDDSAPGAQRYPLFHDKFNESPETAQALMVDVQNVLTQHFNQTCVRENPNDPRSRIIKPGEKLDAERAVVYLEGILAKMQVRARNPGQHGAVSQTANAGAARPQAPKPLTPRDLSSSSMPTDAEIAQMSDEETEALAMRLLNGG
jgi:hypothetical protein